MKTTYPKRSSFKFGITWTRMQEQIYRNHSQYKNMEIVENSQTSRHEQSFFAINKNFSART